VEIAKFEAGEFKNGFSCYFGIIHKNMLSWNEGQSALNKDRYACSAPLLCPFTTPVLIILSITVKQKPICTLFQN
jgi:hypothetical protein